MDGGKEWTTWMRDLRGDVDEVGYLTRLENEHKASRRQRQAVTEAPVQIAVTRGDVMLPLCQINSGSVKPPLCVYASDKLIINGGIYDSVLGSRNCSFNYYLGYEGRGGHIARKSV